MKNKTKNFLYDDAFAHYDGKVYRIAVYAEVTENDELDGILIQKVKFGAKSKQIVWRDDNPTWLDAKKQTLSRVRSFNMGFALYNETDETEPYSKEMAIKIAKRRFSKSPMTTQNMRFLNEDMVNAIIKNEAKFISDRIYLFLPKEDFDILDNTEEPMDEKEECPVVEDSPEMDETTLNDSPVEMPLRKTKDFADGDYAIFETGEDGVVNAACIKAYRDDIKTANCYWVILTKEDGTYELQYDYNITNPMVPMPQEEENIDNALREHFYKKWDKKTKKFWLVF